MSHFTRIATTALFALSLTACGSLQVGHDFDLRTFETKIERGVSTRDQVSKWLGSPNSSGVNVDTSGEHFDEWTYYYASGKPSDMSAAKVKTLQIKFDRQGVVRGYSWSASDK